jgi:hypothetical protein
MRSDVDGGRVASHQATGVWMLSAEKPLSLLSLCASQDWLSCAVRRTEDLERGTLHDD